MQSTAPGSNANDMKSREPTASSMAKPEPRVLDMDPYDEEEAELRFLLSKPTCFLMLGKPGAGKTTLARRLAQEWKCEIVNGE